MKTIITIALFSLLLTSCSTNSDKESLLGIWDSTTMYNKTEMHFYKDSLTIDKFGMHSQNKWQLDGNKIYITKIKGESISPKTKFVLDYKFDSKGDTLYLKSPKDSIFRTKYVKKK